jgi:uncharacterized protein YuzE
MRTPMLDSEYPDLSIDDDNDLLTIRLNDREAVRMYPVLDGLSVSFDANGNICALELHNASAVIDNPDWLSEPMPMHIVEALEGSQVTIYC